MARRTSTPLRVEHEIAIKIFFSVQGETRQGEAMADTKQQGEVRMLVISVPVVIASVSNKSSRVVLQFGHSCGTSSVAASSKE